jgi:hypothetical protein
MQRKHKPLKQKVDKSKHNQIPESLASLPFKRRKEWGEPIQEANPYLFMNLMTILQTYLNREEKPGSLFVVKNGMKIIL